MKKKYIESIASQLGISTKRVRPVDGFPGYFVTDCGKVFSCLREKPLRMKSHKVNTGYNVVNLSKEGAVHSVYVHHLVLKNFVGDPPVGFRAHFKNKDKDDMALDNLEWRPSTTKAWAAPAPGGGQRWAPGAALRGQRPLSRSGNRHADLLRPQAPRRD